jgi:capsular polysaccharide biosynthesis protein
MELKEFIQEIRKQWKFFSLFIIGTILITIFYLLLQPVRYTTILSLHIARSGSGSQTNEYQYDDFYRLQADERFADTVVRWLSSPRIVADIYKETGRNISVPAEHTLGKVFSAKRLSSQYIEVRFTTATQETAETMTNSLEKILNQRTKDLNSEALQNNNWFRIIIEKPVIYPYYIPWTKILLGSLLVGIVLAMWAVGLRSYFIEIKRK